MANKGNPNGDSLTIEKLQIEVAASTGKAVTNLKKLETVLEKIENLGKQPGFTELYIKLRKIASLDFTNATATMGKFATGASNMSKSAKRMGKVKKAVDGVSESIDHLSKKINTLSRVSRGGTQPFGKFNFGESDFDRKWNIFRKASKAMEFPRIGSPSDYEPNWKYYKYDDATRFEKFYRSAFESAKREFEYRIKIKKLYEGQKFYPATQGSRRWAYGNARQRDFGFKDKTGGADWSWYIPNGPNIPFGAGYSAFRSRMNIPRLESVNQEANFHTTTSFESTIFNMQHAFDNLKRSAEKFSYNLKYARDAMREIKKDSKKTYTAFTAMKTILIYSVLFSSVSMVTKGITEGLQNIAIYGKEANKILTEYKTISLQVKNAIGSAVLPILQVLLPVIKTLSNLLIDIANSINVIMSAIAGNSTFIKSKRYVDDYVKSLGKLKGLAGMDQITTIGNQYNYSDMFETVQMSNSQIAVSAANMAELASAIAMIAALFKGKKWAKNISAITGKTRTLKDVLKSVAGITMTIFGTSELIEGSVEGWVEGIDWNNFLQILGGAVMMTGGLYTLFGKTGFVIGGLVGGVTELVVGFKDLDENGRTLQNTLTILSGILSVGLAGAKAGLGSVSIEISAVVALITSLVLWGDKIQSSIETFTEKLNDFTSGALTKLNNLIDSIVEKVSAYSPELGLLISNFGEKLEFVVGLLKDVFNWNLKVFGDSAKIIHDLFNGEWKQLGEDIKKFYKDLFGGIANILIDALNFMIGSFENFVNFFVHGINHIINGLNKIKVKDLLHDEVLFGVNIGEIGDVSFGRIPKFATGGFPEDGLFMANSGELVGKFSDGRSAVANNEQIIDGIARGVYEATSEQTDLLREQNKILWDLLEKDSSGDISISSVTRGLERQNRRNGRVIVPVGS